MGSSVGNILKAALPAVAAVATTALGAPELAPYVGAGVGGLEGATSGGGVLGTLEGAASGYGTGNLGQGLYTAGSSLAGGSTLGDAFSAGFPTAANIGSTIKSGVGSLFGSAASAAPDANGIIWDTPSAFTGSDMSLASPAAVADGLATNTISPFTNPQAAADAMTAAKLAGGPSSTLNNFLTTGSTLANAAPAAGAAAGAGGGSSAFGGLGLGGILSGASGIMNAGALNSAEKQLKSQQELNQQEVAPYLAAGKTGATNLGSLLSGSTALSSLENTPGYQFQLEQGNNALNNQMSAGGMLDSGAALKAAQMFGQGLAGTTYQNAVNNALESSKLGLNATGSNADYNTALGQIGAAGTLGQNNNLLKALAGLFGRNPNMTMQ